MKLKIIYISLFVGFFGLIWTACDKVEEPLTLISEQTTTEGVLDPVYVVDSVIVDYKQVLLEDFTGHKCVNCAGAAIGAHELAEEVDHKLIIYSVHAGYYAWPDETGLYTTDFTTQTGEDLYAEFGIAANPIGMVNRVEYDNNILISEGDWATLVYSELDKPNLVDLKITNIYYPTLQDTMQIKVTATFNEALAGEHKIVVYIVEDHIVSPQKNNEEPWPIPDWLDYEHRNMLRGAVNTTYGEAVSTEPIVAGEDYKFNFTYHLDPEWVTENCNIIVYILNDESREILQVAELGIKTEE